jgi:hypothetical protein
MVIKIPRRRGVSSRIADFLQHHRSFVRQPNPLMIVAARRQLISPPHSRRSSKTGVGRTRSHGPARERLWASMMPYRISPYSSLHCKHLGAPISGGSAGFSGRRPKILNGLATSLHKLDHYEWSMFRAAAQSCREYVPEQAARRLLERHSAGMSPQSAPPDHPRRLA